jgi:hypothetical protein
MTTAQLASALMDTLDLTISQDGFLDWITNLSLFHRFDGVDRNAPRSNELVLSKGNTASAATSYLDDFVAAATNLQLSNEPFV